MPHVVVEITQTHDDVRIDVIALEESNMFEIAFACIMVCLFCAVFGVALLLRHHRRPKHVYVSGYNGFGRKVFSATYMPKMNDLADHVFLREAQSINESVEFVEIDRY